jgi:hypothetical protein
MIGIGNLGVVVFALVFVIYLIYRMGRRVGTAEGRLAGRDDAAKQGVDKADSSAPRS